MSEESGEEEKNEKTPRSARRKEMNLLSENFWIN